ncbi:MAG: polymorphic toxin-type HINT domain-containing protein [Sumerlaeia bacterium]
MLEALPMNRFSIPRALWALLLTALFLLAVASTEASGRSYDDEPVDPATWLQVQFVMDKEGGHRVEVGLLRPAWWLEERQIDEAGDVIHLDLAEMGAVGPAKVVSLGPCPPIKPKRPGSETVIGKFVHDGAQVQELVFSGSEGEPIGVTASHPFWSETRSDWVEAGALAIGEEVQTADGGRAKLLERREVPGLHKVYNLEVHRAHVYRVGEQGILVHNKGPKKSVFPENPTELFPENYPGMTKTVKPDGKIVYDVEAGGKNYKVEYHPDHGGTEHFDGDHYHVKKQAEQPKPGKTVPDYFRLKNHDPNTPAQPGGGTFAPGDNLPTTNN